MSAGSINASNESPANSASSTRVSSPGSYVAFPDPQLFSQPIAIPIPANQNNSTTGVPRQLSAGNTPYPRTPDVPIELNIPLGRLSPQSVRNAIATTDLGPPTLRAIIDALVETSNSCHQQYQHQVQAQNKEHKTAIDKLEEDLEFASPVFSIIRRPLSKLQMGMSLTIGSPRSPSPSERDPTFQQNGSNSSTMDVSPATASTTAQGTSPTLKRSTLPHPTRPSTCQKFFPFGFGRPFKGQPFSTRSSTGLYRTLTTGGFMPKSSTTASLMRTSSLSRPSSTSTT